MWMPKNNNVGVKEGGSSGIVAVAIDKDKSSQHALKWAVDHLLQRGQSVILVHVKLRPSPLNNSPSLHASSASKQTLSFFYIIFFSSLFSFVLLVSDCFVFLFQS